MTSASEQPTTVSILRCEGYDDNLAASVKTLLANIGGLDHFVKPHQSVLIKPNLLTDRAPEEGVTTHPELVRAVIRAIREHGAHPSVGDSPANAAKLETVWKKTGFLDLCREEDVPLINLHKSGSKEFTSGGFSFSVATPILEADVVINMPKVKSHILTILTAAVKNMYGTIPGFLKTTLHKVYPRPAEFGRLVAAIYENFPPALNIADGILGMQGDGPSGGEPVALGFLAASPDAISLDLTLCRILGINPRSVPYLRPYLQKGSPLREIEVLGDSPDGLLSAPFKAPSTLRGTLIPGPLVKLVAPFLWIRPRFSDKCVACGLCLKACPAEALSMGKARRPELTPRNCIGCCCCHEICPERAISMEQSPFLRVIRGGRPL